ncbi:MAG: DUF58 domain-containing protein [Chloroflexi bacterium]|nr:DUF58 domain-containing protein [Chloroflexota bacterium]
MQPPGEAERLLRRLDFTVIRRLDGLRQGDHRNVAYGAGLDLAELREYQPGDDVRALDWNVTARMGQAYVRRYHEDRDITAWLVLDLTASTDFGSALQTKRERLIDIAGTLARLLTGRGDRVGALLYEGSAGRSRGSGTGSRGSWQWRSPALAKRELPAEVVAAAGGRAHVLQLLQRALAAVRRASAAVGGSPARRRATDLAALLRQTFGTVRQHSLVIVLSDFLTGEAPASGHSPTRGGESTWERALGPLARRHELVGVWVRDPREIELPDVGVVTFEDAETGEQLVVDTSQPSVRETYASQASERLKRMEHLFGRHGAALWTVTTAAPLVPALVRFLDQRRRTAIGAQRLQGRPA